MQVERNPWPAGVDEGQLLVVPRAETAPWGRDPAVATHDERVDLRIALVYRLPNPDLANGRDCLKRLLKGVGLLPRDLP